jgi:hypothetical protein
LNSGGEVATRRERVVLELEDNFTSGMAKAAAAAALLDRNLSSLDGSASGANRSLADTAPSIDATGRSAGTASRDIDRFSGRLRLLADAAAVLGPALVPLGAAAVPAVAGLTAQMGAAAGGVGVMVAAFSGLGDALESINKYQLEPTEANLAAMREELGKMDASALDFVRFIESSMGPQLLKLQTIARQGFLPGVQDALEDLLGMAPQVGVIFADLSLTMGDLARSAGEALSGERFAGFFSYLEREAGPLLQEFGQTLGNVAEGIANMVVAFGPVSDMFSDGLLGMSQAFAEWSRGLQDKVSVSSLRTFSALARRSLTFWGL